MIAANTLHGLDLEFDKTLKDLEGDLEDFEAHLGRISDRFKSALDLVSPCLEATM